MGSNGRAWVASAFAWSRVAEQTIEAYQWLVNGGKQPDCVRLD
jgi:glycosyltransferase involved in cell wall biosynthesis